MKFFFASLTLLVCFAAPSVADTWDPPDFNGPSDPPGNPPGSPPDTPPPPPPDTPPPPPDDTPVPGGAAKLRGTVDWLLTHAQGTAFANAELDAAIQLLESSDNDWSKLLEFTFAERATDHPQEQMIRLYLAFFNRLPDAAGLEFWTSKISAGLTAEDVAASFMEGAEFQAKFGNPGNEEFVRLAYQNTLLRQPDAVGLEFWTGKLNEGASRASIMASFSRGIEFGIIRRADFVAARTLLNLFGEGANGTITQWSTFLRENPGETGEADFFARVAGWDIFPDLIEVQRPVVEDVFFNAISDRLLGRSLSSDELAAAKLSVDLNEKSHAEWVQEILESEEFLETLAPVFRLYQAYFSRYPDTAGLEFWTNRFATDLPALGQENALIVISRSFANSDEFAVKYGDVDNRRFIELIYANVLRRNPDPEGLDFWTAVLDNGRPREELLAVGFTQGNEFIEKIADEQFAYFAGVFLSEEPGNHALAWVKSWAAYFKSGGDRSELVHQLLSDEGWAAN